MNLIYKFSIEPEAYSYILMELQPDKRMVSPNIRAFARLAANAWPAVFPIVLYNGGRKWNAKTELSRCIENKWVPEKYKMSYYLISKIHNLADALVRSVVYAEQHSEDNKRENYLEKLEYLAKKIVPAELKQAFWFTLISTMPK